MSSNKCLVIILSETRASHLTFDNIKRNLIDVLNADLCVCIGVKEDYDNTDPFYQLAKYRFVYDEPDDYATAFDFAYNEILKYAKDVESPQIYWREYLKIKDQFMGKIKDENYQHPGSGAVGIFYRWFLLRNLISNNLLSKYDRFVITRSDYIFTLPHPILDILDKEHIWIPNCEDYSGYNDRHVVLSPSNIVQYLNILNNMVVRSQTYYNELKQRNYINIEQLVKYNIEKNGCLHMVKRYPYIMYTIRDDSVKNSWVEGEYYAEHNYYVKYKSEYVTANYYKNLFEHCDTNDLVEFYKCVIDILGRNNI